jgi:hypothetical protein
MRSGDGGLRRKVLLVSSFVLPHAGGVAARLRRRAVVFVLHGAAVRSARPVSVSRAGIESARRLRAEHARGQRVLTDLVGRVAAAAAA